MEPLGDRYSAREKWRGGRRQRGRKETTRGGLPARPLNLCFFVLSPCSPPIPVRTPAGPQSLAPHIAQLLATFGASNVFLLFAKHLLGAFRGDAARYMVFLEALVVGIRLLPLRTGFASGLSPQHACLVLGVCCSMTLHARHLSMMPVHFRN